MNAKEIATLAHQGQFRRDGVTPYIEHPEAVASAFEEGSLEWEAAFVHDVLEDSDWTADQLREHLDDFVVDAVVLLTHREKNEPYLNYIRRILNTEGLAAQIALRVKLADMGANLADDPSDRQKEKYGQALQLIAANMIFGSF